MLRHGQPVVGPALPAPGGPWVPPMFGHGCFGAVVDGVDEGVDEGDDEGEDDEGEDEGTVVELFPVDVLPPVAALATA